jgi:hypothetical protein
MLLGGDTPSGMPLSQGGQVTMPLAPAFWAKTFGMLTDHFGISWAVNGEPIAFEQVAQPEPSAAMWRMARARQSLPFYRRGRAAGGGCRRVGRSTADRQGRIERRTLVRRGRTLLLQLVAPTQQCAHQGRGRDHHGVHVPRLLSHRSSACRFHTRQFGL